MIQIKPVIASQPHCPTCAAVLEPEKVLWQGMHVCVRARCARCRADIVADLPVGHAVTNPYQVDLSRGQVYGPANARSWLGDPLLHSLQQPRLDSLEIKQEVFRNGRRAIILNCIDFLYGHSLLKLLNAQRHLEDNPDYALILLIPRLLRWLVPQGVAEVWTVPLSLQDGQSYYPFLDRSIKEACRRFDQVYVSQAHSHPSRFDITWFTGVEKHSFADEEFAITFIWREDRLWCHPFLFRLLRKLRLMRPALALQQRKVEALLARIRRQIPEAAYAVAGFGGTGRFPSWIADHRVTAFDEQAERRLCQQYGRSRLVIGVHGSNMLLPSGQAGMTLDLMPPKRWGNMVQDVLYHEPDPRIAAFRYRYLPMQTNISELAHAAVDMVRRYEPYRRHMTMDKRP